MNRYDKNARIAFASAVRSGDLEQVRQTARTIRTERGAQQAGPRIGRSSSRSFAELFALLLALVPQTLAAAVHGRVDWPSGRHLDAPERSPQDDWEAVGDLLWSAMIDDATRDRDVA